MLYGIEFRDSEKGLEEYSEEVRNEIATSDRFDIYFSNPVTAIKVASHYEKLDEGLVDYSVFELTAEQEKVVDKSKIVDTEKQFYTLHAENTKNSIKNTVNRTKEARIFANFKAKFDAMTEAEQFAYLDSMGLKYKVQNQDEMDRD